MSKHLIATIYNHYSIIATATNFSVNHITLLVDESPNETMKKSIELIENSLGSVMKIKKCPVALYDIVHIAEQTVQIIDSLPEKDEIFVDITSGRKPKSLGLLFASYARAKRISKICYVTEDTKQIIRLPIMPFTMNSTQLEVLQTIHKNTNITTSQIAEELGVSKGIVYRYIKEMLDWDAVEKNGEILKLSDFGRIMVL